MSYGPFHNSAISGQPFPKLCLLFVPYLVFFEYIFFMFRVNAIGNLAAGWKLLRQLLISALQKKINLGLS